jgi:hypothetical protein
MDTSAIKAGLNRHSLLTLYYLSRPFRRDIKVMNKLLFGQVGLIMAQRNTQGFRTKMNFDSGWKIG